MLLNSQGFPCINGITHEGKVLLFGTDSDGIIWYTVKQDGFEDSYLNSTDAHPPGWEAWKQLMFPNEKDDDSVVAKEKATLTYSADPSKFILRSRYNTTGQSAVAPVQLVSGLGHLYVFRQSKSHTLLVDRFVLDGMTNTLTRKLEVRFKRSKQRYEPSGNQKKGTENLLLVDSLDFRDINGKDFWEPTTELSLVENLTEGHFSVVLIPTNEQDKYRWHIFAYNSASQKVEVTTLRASDDGLFEPRDYTVLDPSPRRISGIIRRTLDLGPDAVFSHGLSATRYDVQKLRQTDVDNQLLRDSVRVMLVYGTTQGNTAAISFGVAQDGTLSPISEEPHIEDIRSFSRPVFLPASSLDDIRAYAGNPIPHGTIDSMKEGKKRELALQFGGSGVEDIEDVQKIKITAEPDLNHVYSEVRKIDENTFEIKHSIEPLGTWEVVPEDEELIYNGRITALEKTSPDTVKVTAQNHGLETGDTVQIVDTRDYNGVFTVTKNGKAFNLMDLSWQAGTALNIKKLFDQKRRGMVFDGIDDHIALPAINFDYSSGITVEAWVHYKSFNSWSRILDFGNGQAKNNILLANNGSNNTLSFEIYQDGKRPNTLSVKNALKTGEWIHVAASADKDGKAKLFINGLEKAAGDMDIPKSVNRTSNFIGRSNWSADGYFDGQLAEVRVWNKARTADEIRNSMYLPLTGGETGLCGYWRLIGIVQDAEGGNTTHDFSVFGNDGTVAGGAYISGRLLDRNLNGTQTPARMFSNDDVFTVTERATYTERLEFKPTPESDGAADLFKFVWKGKKNRSSRTWEELNGKGTQIEKRIGSDWYTASASFTVPDGISLVRLFGIEVNKPEGGSWTELEIRNHKITQVSDTITKAVHADSAKLPVLADTQKGRQAILEQIADLEIQQGRLELEIRKHIRENGTYEDIQKHITKLTNDVKNGTQNVQNLTEKGKRLADQESYIKAHGAYVVLDYDGKQLQLDLSEKNLSYYDVRGGLLGSGGFLGSGYFKDSWNNKPEKINVPVGYIAVLYLDEDFKGEQLELHAGNHNLRDKHVSSKDTDWVHEASSIKVMTAEGRYTASQKLTDAIETNKNELSAAISALRQKREELANLEKTAKTPLEGKQARLADLKKKLKNLAQVFYGDPNTPLPQTLSDLATKSELATRGAVLEFFRPVGRLHALETCEGKVQLSYFDTEGRMRQANFDAAYDSINTTAEQWLPEPVRSCLHFSDSKTRMTLEKPIDLKEEWSVEAWFFYPLPENSSKWATLIAGDENEDHISIKLDDSAERIGIYLESKYNYRFQDIDFDMKELAPGWHHLVVVAGGNDKDARTEMYIDGRLAGQVEHKTNHNIHYIGNDPAGGRPFGKLAEVRVWGLALSPAEVAVNSQTTLTGNEPGLLAYYSMAENEGTKIADKSGNDHTANLNDGTAWWPCAAPWGSFSGQTTQSDGIENSLVSAEYVTTGLDPQTGTKISLMRRMFASPASDGVRVLTDKRIELLELMWIGNGQFAPTLLGFIEGPPPVPSENLTIEENYNGATSVELTLSEDVEFNWHRSSDFEMGANVDTFIGTGTKTDAVTTGLGLGTAERALETRAGLKGGLEFNYQFQNDSSITASSSQVLADKLELRGTREREANFPHLGKRFIPKNVGYALVVSALADVFISRLARTKKMIGYQVLPVEGIPPDINTITFLINPAYTMSGSLDGMTGSSATSQRFFKHVPDMRTQYGSLYPASYYRLKEAYDLKEQIEQQDKNREAYFAQFSARLVNDLFLEGEINKGAAPTDVGVHREEDKPSDEPLAESQEQEKINADLKQSEADAQAQQDQQSDAVKKKNAEIRKKIEDGNARAHASTCFESWQRKMEDIQIRAGKRNIVNTYVWDADGGLRSEAQSFASAAEHIIGGSFEFNAALGFEGKFQVLGAQVELTAQATFNLTQTMSKTQTRSRGIELNIDLGGVESRGVTDYNDLPIQPGEKVDRYRFMSFYLEGSTDNFKDFFNYVVDPEWLASNSEEARALRQARGKPNKAWRVLHRVTYVERPALMGFGRDLRAFSDVQDDSNLESNLIGMRDAISTLQKENSTLKEKLDLILSKMK